MEIAIVLGLVLLNGLFAMSEIALMTSRKARLQKLSEAGDHGARAAMLLGDDPNKFLSTIQIGITSIGILNGIVGEATLRRSWRVAASAGLGMPDAALHRHGIGGDDHYLLFDHPRRTGAQMDRPDFPRTDRASGLTAHDSLAMATQQAVCAPAVPIDRRYVEAHWRARPREAASDGRRVAYGAR